MMHMHNRAAALFGLQCQDLLLQRLASGSLHIELLVDLVPATNQEGISVGG